MNRRIIAIVFLIIAVITSVTASFKVQNTCKNTTDKIENIIKTSQTDIQFTKAQTQSIYEYWQKNSSILQIFVGTKDVLDVKLSIAEMLFLLEQNNLEDFLEEAYDCKKQLFRIKDSEKNVFW